MNRAARHRHALAGALIAVAAASACASGGTGSEIRSVTIENFEFKPSRIDVAAETPVKLDFELIGPADVAVSIPSLGVAATAVPANRRNMRSVKAGTRTNLKRLRIELGPLAPGAYAILCDCAEDAAAYLVVQ